MSQARWISAEISERVNQKRPLGIKNVHFEFKVGNMHISPQDFIIKGITTAGKSFRPGDWAERLSGVLSSFGVDNRMSYSPYVRPITLNGIKCVAVDKNLKEVEPQGFRFLMGFAQDNDLLVEEGAACLNKQHDAVAIASQ